MKILSLDFEFNRVTQEYVNLVCCVTKDESNGLKTKFWLHNNESEKKKLVEHLKKYDILQAWNVVAEARSCLALGMNPIEMLWVDLFLEYRCIANHNDNINYGPQYVDGKVITAKKPKKKWELLEGETNEGGFKHTHSLVEATYKLTGKIRDSDHKTVMRDLIISDPKEFTSAERTAILKYCEEDVDHLGEIAEAINKEYVRLDASLAGKEKTTILEDALTKGRYAAHTAIMESRGYPIDYEKTKNFSKSVTSILYDCQREINELFPAIKPFVWNKKDNRFSWDQKGTREWISTLPYVKQWELTDTKQISLSLEAFEKFFPFKHDYPKDNLGAQFVRFLKLKQSLYGFVPVPNSKRKNFWDYVGPDKRVRPYMNIYGAQSSRSQPSATGFMMLKPAWMRALVQPAKGMAIASIDYGSEEYLISALLSEDWEMINSYLSGDPYLALAKLTGAVPQNATRSSHPEQRDLHKSTVLGLSFNMSKYGLAIKLTQDTGRIWTEDQAQEQIDAFYEAYSGLAEYQQMLRKYYEDEGQIRLPCGWTMFGDNENFRSVGNAPVQGLGSSIMRKAVELAFAKGLYVCMTLHDALYIEYKVGEEYKVKVLQECMREAFTFYFPEDMKHIAAQIRMDPFAWSQDYPEDGTIDCDGLIVDCSNIYIDSRAKSDYEKFKQYFNAPIEDEL